MGGKWRKGDGSPARIFKDAWLLGSSPGRIISPPSILLETETVSSLFTAETRGWNVELIDEIFLPYEANLIKSLPIVSSS